MYMCISEEGARAKRESFSHLPPLPNDQILTPLSLPFTSLPPSSPVAYNTTSHFYFIVLRQADRQAQRKLCHYTGLIIKDVFWREESISYVYRGRPAKIGYMRVVLISYKLFGPFVWHILVQVEQPSHVFSRF